VPLDQQLIICRVSPSALTIVGSISISSSCSGKLYEHFEQQHVKLNSGFTVIRYCENLLKIGVKNKADYHTLCDQKTWSDKIYSGSVFASGSICITRINCRTSCYIFKTISKVRQIVFEQSYIRIHIQKTILDLPRRYRDASSWPT
jgi:hypothetical protein